MNLKVDGIKQEKPSDVANLFLNVSLKFYIKCKSNINRGKNIQHQQFTKE